MASRPHVLVFDLGGVLLDLNDPAEIFDVQANREAFLKMWIHSPAVRAYESGALDADAFAGQIVNEASLPYDAREFIDRFDRWPGALFEGVTDLLADLGSRYRLALLSNTNARHWRQDGVSAVLEPLFHKCFLSFETGAVKPDEAAFGKVANEFGRSPSAIAFFDDNPANVSAARKFGFRAILARGPDDIRSSVADFDA